MYLNNFLNKRVLSFDTTLFERSLKIKYRQSVVYLGVALLLLQLMDGLLTYKGILTFGIEVEGNPLVLQAMKSFGVIEGLVLVKGVASSLVVGVLFVAGKFSWIPYALLGVSGTYLFCAVLPWLMLLNI